MAVHKRKRNPNARPIALRQGRRHEQRQRNEARFLEVGTGGRVRRIRAVALRRHGRPGRAGRWRRRDQQRLRRSEEHTSELQSQFHLVCRLLLEKKKKTINTHSHTKKKKKKNKIKK